jgi:site-specific DNA recombinase
MKQYSNTLVRSFRAARSVAHAGVLVREGKVSSRNAKQTVLDGQSKTLYFWRTDRLSRLGMGAVDGQVADLAKRGARLVSTSEGLDSSRPGMRLIFGILADRAREEAQSISDRTSIGKTAHKAEGKWPGGHPPTGFAAPREQGR